jgi:hypothetical protein
LYVFSCTFQASDIAKRQAVNRAREQDIPEDPDQDETHVETEVPTDQEEVVTSEHPGALVPDMLEALEPDDLEEHLLASDESENMDHSHGQLLSMADRSKPGQSTGRGWFKRRPTEIQFSPKASTHMLTVELAEGASGLEGKGSDHMESSEAAERRKKGWFAKKSAGKKDGDEPAEGEAMKEEEDEPAEGASGEEEKGNDHVDSNEAAERRKKGWFAKKSVVDTEDKDHVATDTDKSAAPNSPKKKTSFWFGRPATSSLMSEEPESEQANEETDQATRPSAPSQDQRPTRVRRTVSQQARQRRSSSRGRLDNMGPLRSSNVSERDSAAPSMRGRSSDGVSVAGTVQSILLRSSSLESETGQSLQERREAARARRQSRRESLSTNKGVR